MKRTAYAVVVMIVVTAASGPAIGATGCTDTQWLIKAYNDSLFRPPNNQELQAWIVNGTLADNATRFDVAWSLLNSKEGIGYLLGLFPQTVNGYYQLVLGRAPINDEFNAWWSLGQFPQGNAPDYAVLSLLIGGQVGAFSYPNEFAAYAVAQNPALAKCSSNAAVVNQIFEVYMGRNATQAEIDLWTAQLVGGAPLQTVALGVSNTPDLAVGQNTGEYFNKVVRDSFQRFLRRPPAPQELVQWSLALSGGTGLNEQLDAVLMSTPEYCTGVVEPFQALPAPPPANVVQQLANNIAPLPQPLNVQAPGPVYSADDVQVFSLQRQVNAQTQTIAMLAGGIVPCPPDRECLPGGETPGQVINDLTAQVGNLTAQNLLQQDTILGQQQQIAQDQTSISSVVLAEFGVAVNQSAATAARDVAQGKIRDAIRAVGNNDPHVQQAQSQYNLGLTALVNSDWNTAMNRFRIAYQAASQALH